MTPITQLSRLISEMTPVLHPEALVFCAIPEAQMSATVFEDFFAIMREDEAITLITTPQQAKKLGYETTELFQRIELKVYSSLEAVGLTAAVSACLTEHNISANVVAAFHHDHILVPQKDADSALQALLKLTENQRTK